MAKSETSFKKGQSGNPSGRPKGLTARAALRLALSRETAGGVTRLMEWAEDLCAETDPEMRLSILKFLEGNQPPPDAGEDGPGVPSSVTINFVRATDRSDGDQST